MSFAPDTLQEIAKPKVEMGNVVKELLKPTDIEHTEITGGHWNDEQGTYTIVEPDHEGVTTVYRLEKHPMLRGVQLIRTEHLKDGKNVVLDEASGQWKEATIVDKGKQRIESLMTTGYVVREKTGGQQTLSDGRVVNVDGMRDKLHVIKQNRPIVQGV